VNVKFLYAKLSIAEWGPSSITMQQQMSFALQHTVPYLLQTGIVTNHYAAMNGSTDSMRGICIQLDTLYDSIICFISLVSPHIMTFPETEKVSEIVGRGHEAAGCAPDFHLYAINYIT
jgi:hypothetical protein